VLGLLYQVELAPPVPCSYRRVVNRKRFSRSARETGRRKERTRPPRPAARAHVSRRAGRTTADRRDPGSSVVLRGARFRSDDPGCVACSPPAVISQMVPALMAASIPGDGPREHLVEGGRASKLNILGLSVSGTRRWNVVFTGRLVVQEPPRDLLALTLLQLRSASSGPWCYRRRRLSPREGFLVTPRGHDT